MDKVIRNGMVAVLYSPGYGAGWYSWNTDHPECLFDPEIVSIIMGETSGNIEEIAKKKWNDGESYFYTGGASNLTIKWLPVGTQFRVDEYDGYESVITSDDLLLIS